MQYNPYGYQTSITKRIEENPRLGVFVDMGLGKTVCTLTALQELLFNRFEAGKVLVIAPKRVAESTWEQEAEKWDHLRGLRFSRILGNRKQRQEALRQSADVYLVNRENVAWLVQECGKGWPFDTLVIDELSSFRNPSSQRFRALRRVLPRIQRRYGLTGTPAPKGLINLWAQIYLLDEGERLGRTFGEYCRRYFHPGRRNGYVVYDWIPNDGAEKEIYARLEDLCVSMKAGDYLELPGRVNILRRVTLPEKARREYQQLEKELLLLGGDAVIANGAADLGNKLQQIAGGAVYTEGGGVREIHDAKLEELENLLEEAGGKPMLVFYAYRHEADRILARLGTEGARLLKDDEDIQAWNRGEIPLLLAHPASAGHGLNLQEGGSIIVWFGMTRDLELYLQGVHRLDRQGQQETVRVYHIIAQGTRDEDCLPVLEGREISQEMLLQALKARVEGYENAQ